MEILLDNKTDAVGSAIFNRKILSLEVTSKTPKEGETVVQYKQMLLMKWKDKEYVNMLSTIHDDPMEEVTVGGKEVRKPDVFIKYKRCHMAGVYLMDQISSTSSARKGVKKYYKKICFD